MSARSLFRRSLVPALLALGFTALVAVPQAARAQTAQKPILRTLHRFDFTHGAGAQSTLTLGSDGSFYGVTAEGGLERPRVGSQGTIFKITPEGAFLTLWRFNGTNGFLPNGPLVEGKDGAFYGTTLEGGTVDTNGIGTVFRITTQGQLTTLHKFTGQEDGDYPLSALTLAPDGSFYGTTTGGGSNGAGTVFHMTASGKLTILRAFGNSEGSVQIDTALVFGRDGAMYGTNLGDGKNGDGEVVRLTTKGTLTTLHEFNGDDGALPYAGLTLGADGAFYGVTAVGGIGGGYKGAGVAYRITSSGVFTTLHKFSLDGHGVRPQANLTEGADGNFYGTTMYGGTGETDSNYSGLGTVFVMTPAGGVTTLYKFHTAFDGQTPYGGVAFGPDGALYGMTNLGGSTDGGTIYKLTLPQ